jgi:hypothetical protein
MRRKSICWFGLSSLRGFDHHSKTASEHKRLNWRASLTTLDRGKLGRHAAFVSLSSSDIGQADRARFLLIHAAGSPLRGSM